MTNRALSFGTRMNPQALPPLSSNRRPRSLLQYLYRAAIYVCDISKHCLIASYR